MKESKAELIDKAVYKALQSKTISSAETIARKEEPTVKPISAVRPIETETMKPSEDLRILKVANVRERDISLLKDICLNAGESVLVSFPLI